MTRQWDSMSLADRDTYISVQVMGIESVPYRGLIPTYTTTMDAAWRVVDRLRSLGYLVTLKDMPAGHTFVIYESMADIRAVCCLDYMPDDCGITEKVRRHVIVSAKTPAEAICLAAIRAVKGEVP